MHGMNVTWIANNVTCAQVTFCQWLDFSAQRRLGELSDLFKENGFVEVKFMARMKRDDLRELNLNLGQIVKLEILFAEAQKDSSNSEHVGNPHYIRRKMRNNGNMGQLQQNHDVGQSGWNHSAQRNGRYRIKYTGPYPGNDELIKCRDVVIETVIRSRVTDIKQIRELVDRATKNGVIAKVRCWFDEDRSAFPNSPIRLAHAAVHRSSAVGLLSIENEEFKNKSYGGYAEWRGTVRQNKMSVTWDNLDEQGRRNLVDHLKDHKGVNWVAFAHETGDYLN